MFDQIVAVNRAFAARQEGFPGNALRIENPGLLGFGVAAGGGAFFDKRCVGALQASIHLVEFVVILHLDSEVIDTLLFATRGNRKIDSWIIEHPFGVVGLDHRRFTGKQRIVKFDRRVEVGNRKVNVHSFHDVLQ